MHLFTPFILIVRLALSSSSNMNNHRNIRFCNFRNCNENSVDQQIKGDNYQPLKFYQIFYRGHFQCMLREIRKQIDVVCMLQVPEATFLFCESI